MVYDRIVWVPVVGIAYLSQAVATENSGKRPL